MVIAEHCDVDDGYANDGAARNVRRGRCGGQQWALLTMGIACNEATDNGAAKNCVVDCGFAKNGATNNGDADNTHWR